MMLWCCTCQTDVEARLTNGAETYPHREDLANLPRWICDTCRCHVGTHHKTSNPTRPLGNIPSPEIKDARIKIHALIDPFWKNGQLKRGQIYAAISREIGYQYHTGEIKTLDEARKIYHAAQKYLKRKTTEESPTHE